LGEEFNGVLGCDYFSAYRRYQREFGVPLQFCLAHLIRDVKFFCLSRISGRPPNVQVMRAAALLY
jgi:hypothetical protein